MSFRKKEIKDGEPNDIFEDRKAKSKGKKSRLGFLGHSGETNHIISLQLKELKDSSKIFEDSHNVSNEVRMGL